MKKIKKRNLWALLIGVCLSVFGIFNPKVHDVVEHIVDVKHHHDSLEFIDNRIIERRENGQRYKE